MYIVLLLGVTLSVAAGATEDLTSHASCFQDKKTLDLLTYAPSPICGPDIADYVNYIGLGANNMPTGGELIFKNRVYELDCGNVSSSRMELYKGKTVPASYTLEKKTKFRAALGVLSLFNAFQSIQKTDHIDTMLTCPTGADISSHEYIYARATSTDFCIDQKEGRLLDKKFVESIHTLPVAWEARAYIGFIKKFGRCVASSVCFGGTLKGCAAKETDAFTVMKRKNATEIVRTFFGNLRRDMKAETKTITGGSLDAQNLDVWVRSTESSPKPIKIKTCVSLGKIVSRVDRMKGDLVEKTIQITDATNTVELFFSLTKLVQFQIILPNDFVKDLQKNSRQLCPDTKIIDEISNYLGGFLDEFQM